ncbi:MAG: glycosyltransferase family 8 protein [Myxococcales bacterium]|jgi:glycogenin glucosyltransferase
MQTAYVTTLCNGEGYLPGVEALGKSLEAHGTQVPRVVLVTSDVSGETRARLSRQGWQVREVEPLENPNPDTIQLFERFRDVFTKLRAWQLVDFAKVVLLDADMITLQNIDDLFERPSISAAPDFFLPDRFNSGLMVLEPSREVFEGIQSALWETPSYDGGDQGFLNEFFPNWYEMEVSHRLPAGYNLQNFIFQFLHGHPSLKQALQREAKVIHYSVQKPWRAKAAFTGGSKAWWDMYFGAHPEKAREWRRRWHAMEDWTFDHAVAAIIK